MAESAGTPVALVQSPHSGIEFGLTTASHEDRAPSRRETLGSGEADAGGPAG